MRLHLPLAALLLLAGCTTAPFVEATPLGAPQPARPEDADVQLFSVRAPDCHFLELALVAVRGNDPAHNREALIARARQLGGDAVAGLAQIVSRSGTDGLQGTVIRFTDPACRH